jgi:site-specific DNA recombinase
MQNRSSIEWAARGQRSLAPHAFPSVSARGCCNVFPDTNKYKRRRRPESEWQEFEDGSLQIVSKALYEQAQLRTRDRSNPDKRLRSGYKRKYLLSGLLICDTCGSHYVIADARSYACSSYLNGGLGACANGIRVRRDAVEAAILDPIREGLLSPARVQMMAKEMKREYARRMESQAERSASHRRSCWNSTRASHG